MLGHGKGQVNARSVLCDGVGVEHEPSTDNARDFSATRRHFAEVLCSVVVGDELDELAVRRKSRSARHSVERFCQHLRGATGCGRKRHVLRRVLQEFRLELRHVGDPLCIRGPRGAYLDNRRLRFSYRRELERVTVPELDAALQRIAEKIAFAPVPPAV